VPKNVPSKPEVPDVPAGFPERVDNIAYPAVGVENVTTVELLSVTVILSKEEDKVWLIVQVEDGEDYSK
jgi:hypothetical protein